MLSFCPRESGQTGTAERTAGIKSLGRVGHQAIMQAAQGAGAAIMQPAPATPPPPPPQRNGATHLAAGR